MADCFLGEIRMFGGNYAPENWVLCQGQTLAISQNDVLYSLIGTTYGGDGVTYFKLPDMRGRVPVHMGTGTGLTPRTIAQSFGTETEAMSAQTMPAHTHTLYAAGSEANLYNPGGNILATNTTASTVQSYTTTNALPISMHASAVQSAGSSQSHNNMMPALCVNFIIALQGYYPQRA